MSAEVETDPYTSETPSLRDRELSVTRSLKRMVSYMSFCLGQVSMKMLNKYKNAIKAPPPFFFSKIGSNVPSGDLGLDVTNTGQGWGSLGT